jgi:microcystin-dependent protein
MTLEVFPVWMLYRDFEVPIGSVVPFAGRCDAEITSPPSGWLICDGRAVSRNVYNKLFKIIGTTYGSGDGATTFNLPNFTHTTDSSGTFRPGYIKGTSPIYNSVTETYSWSGSQLPGTTEGEQFNLDLIDLAVNVDATISEYAPTVSQWQVVLGSSNDNTHSHMSGGNSSAVPNDYRYTYIDDADHRTATHDNNARAGSAQLHLPGRLRKHTESAVDLPPILTTLDAGQIWSLKNDSGGTALYYPKSGPGAVLGENNELAGFLGPDGTNNSSDSNRYISFGTYNTSSFVSRRFIKFKLNTAVAGKVTFRLIAGSESNGGERPNNNGQPTTINGISYSTRDETLYLEIRTVQGGSYTTTRKIQMIPSNLVYNQGFSAYDSTFGSWKDYDVNLNSNEQTENTEFWLYAESSDPRIFTDESGKDYIAEIPESYNTLLSNFPNNFRNALDNYGLGSVTYELSAADALGILRPYGSYYDAAGTAANSAGEFDRISTWNHTHRNDYSHTTSNASQGIIGGVSHPQSSVSENQSTIGSFNSLNGKFYVDGSPSLQYSLGSGSAVYGQDAGPYDGGGSGEFDELRGFGVFGTEKYLSLGRYSSSKPSDGIRSFTVTLDTRYANVVEFNVIAGNDQNGAERPNNLGEGLYCQINNKRIVQVIPSNQEYRAITGKNAADASSEYASKYGGWHVFKLPLTDIGENKQNCEFRFFSKSYSLTELSTSYEEKVISASSLATDGTYAAVVGSGCALYDFRDGPGKNIDIGNGAGNNEWGGFEHPKEDGASNWIRSGDNSKSSNKKYISWGTFSSPHVNKRELTFRLNTFSAESITFTLIAGSDTNGGEIPNNYVSGPDESLYLEINNPDGGTRSKILLIPSATYYNSIVKSDTTSGKTDDAAIRAEWISLFGFWRDYTINLKQNERGANVEFRLYAESQPGTIWHEEILKTKTTVTVKDLEFSSGGPLSPDTKGGTYGLRIGNGVDINGFESGPGKAISSLNQWSGFAKPTDSDIDRHVLFGSFIYVIKDDNMLGGGSDTSRDHVNLRRMRFQLDTSATDYVDFKLIAGTDGNGGERPNNSGESLYLEIRDSSDNLLRSNILLIPSSGDSAYAGDPAGYATAYGSWKDYRISLNGNEKARNTIFILYAYSNDPIITDGVLGEAEDMSSLANYPDDYLNALDQYGLAEISYDKFFASSLSNVDTDYLNARDNYGLFQISLLRNKIYPEINIGNYLEAVDQYGLKEAETKYETYVRWYANTQPSILPVSNIHQVKFGEGYIKYEMGEGCAVYPERSSNDNPAPGKNIDPFGAGTGNNEYGGFAKSSNHNFTHYLSFGTFNSPFRIQKRSTTLTLNTTDAYKIGIWAIAGNDRNGGERPNDSGEGLYVKIDGGSPRLIIPHATDTSNYQSGINANSGVTNIDEWDAYFGQWREYIIPGDWFPKSTSVTFEFYNEVNSQDGPVKDNSNEITLTDYPADWSSSTPTIFQKNRNWFDSYGISAINFYNRINYYTLNSGCSIQNWRSGPANGISVDSRGAGNNELGGFMNDNGVFTKNVVSPSEYIMFGSYGSPHVEQRSVTLNLDTRGASIVELCVIAGNDINGGERPNDPDESLYARIGGSSGRRVQVIPSRRKFTNDAPPSTDQNTAWDKLYSTWHSYYIYLTDSEKVGNLEILLRAKSNPTYSSELEGSEVYGFDPASLYPNALDTYGLAYAAIHYSESCYWNFGEKTGLVQYQSGPTSTSKGYSNNDNEFAGFSNSFNPSESKSYLMFGTWAPIIGTGTTDGSFVGGNGTSSPDGYRVISFRTNTERVKRFEIRARQGNDVNGGENPNASQGVGGERLEMVIQKGTSSDISNSGGVKTLSMTDLENESGKYALRVFEGVDFTTYNTGPGKSISGGEQWAGFPAPTGTLATNSNVHCLFGSFVYVAKDSNGLPTTGEIKRSHVNNRKFSFKLNVEASDYIEFTLIAGTDGNGGERPNGVGESLKLEIRDPGGSVLRNDIVLIPSTGDSAYVGNPTAYDQQYGIWKKYKVLLNENEKTIATTFVLYAYSDSPIIEDGKITEASADALLGLSGYPDNYLNALDQYGIAAITYDAGTPGSILSRSDQTDFDNWNTYNHGLSGDERDDEVTVFFRDYVDPATFATNTDGVYMPEISDDSAYLSKTNFALASDTHGIAYIDVEYESSTNLQLDDGTGCEGNHAHSLNFQLDRGHNHVITGQTGNANISGEDSSIEPKYLPMVYIIHTG